MKVNQQIENSIEYNTFVFVCVTLVKCLELMWENIACKLGISKYCKKILKIQYYLLPYQTASNKPVTLYKRL